MVFTRPCLGGLAFSLGLVHSGAGHVGLPRASMRTGMPTHTAVPSLRKSVQARADGSKGVVITGGAGGVGYAYANEFVRRGHKVVICDVRDPTDAVRSIGERYKGAGSIYGTQCDVSDAASVTKLADFAKENLGTVHYWVNNAGINGGRRPFSTLSMQNVEMVAKVNLIGILLCTKAAQELLSKQQGVTSHIFNTVGSGVKGGGTPGYVAYGATKRGLPQMTQSLVDEMTKGVPGFDVPAAPGTVNFHTISPGMVFTDLLLNDSTPELRKFPFGVLAAQPKEVAEDLVPKILATDGNGQKVEFLDTPRVLQSFFKRFVLQEKSPYIDDDGNVIKLPGQEYQDNGVAKQYAALNQNWASVASLVPGIFGLASFTLVLLGLKRFHSALRPVHDLQDALLPVL